MITCSGASNGTIAVCAAFQRSRPASTSGFSLACAIVITGVFGPFAFAFFAALTSGSW